MKVFDWEKAKESNSPEKLEFLRAVADTKISEAEFLAAGAKARLTATKTRHFNPCDLRHDYRNLKEKFGWFQ